MHNNGSGCNSKGEDKQHTPKKIFKNFNLLGNKKNGEEEKQQQQGSEHAVAAVPINPWVGDVACGGSVGCTSCIMRGHVQASARHRGVVLAAFRYMHSSPQPLRWSKLADTAGHRLHAPAPQTMSSSIGSVRFFSSKFHADTCNIYESAPIFGATLRYKIASCL